MRAAEHTGNIPGERTPPTLHRAEIKQATAADKSSILQKSSQFTGHYSLEYQEVQQVGDKVVGRLISLALVIGAGYWYWSAVYQHQASPSYDEVLERYAEDMRTCVRGLNYKAGTGAQTGDPETICSERLNLYKDGGRWHSYDDIRRD